MVSPSFLFFNRFFLNTSLENRFIFTKTGNLFRNTNWILYTSNSFSNYILVFFFRFIYYAISILFLYYLFSTLLISDVSFLNFLIYIFWRFFDLFYFFILNFFFLNFLIVISWLLSFQFIFNIYFLNLSKFINNIFFERLFYKNISLTSKKNYTNIELFYNFNKGFLDSKFFNTLNLDIFNIFIFKNFYKLYMQLFSFNNNFFNSPLSKLVYFFEKSNKKIDTSSSFLLTTNLVLNKNFLLTSFYKLNSQKEFFYFDFILLNFIKNLKISRWFFLENSTINNDIFLYKNFINSGFTKSISNENESLNSAFEFMFFRDSFIYNNSFSYFYNYNKLFKNSISDKALEINTFGINLNFISYLFNSSFTNTLNTSNNTLLASRKLNLHSINSIISKETYNFFKTHDLNFFFLISKEPSYIYEYNTRYYVLHITKDEYFFVHNFAFLKDIQFLN